MDDPKLDQTMRPASSAPSAATGESEPTLINSRPSSQPPPDPSQAASTNDAPSTIPPASFGSTAGSVASHSGSLPPPSLPPQDLSTDRLLKNAPRSSLDGTAVMPSLGGIPLMAKLGQGGMGAVYYGIHPRLRQEVAVKVLPIGLADQNHDLVKRFHREAEVASRVKSPHLIGVMDINQEGEMFYLVMEFVNGASAGQYLKQLKQAGKQGLDEADALDIIIAATEGLAAAHAQAIIHRDIKPDNIMIPRSRPGSHMLFKESKLADLGLARDDAAAQSLTQSGVCMGTVGYMAPEQAMDAKHVGKPGDVFSMGATLYALLAGNAPFTGATAMKILLATTQEPHPPMKSVRADVSPVVSELLDRCLHKDPARRYVDGTALLAALKVCRAGGGTQSAIAELTMLQGAKEVGAKLALSQAPAAVPAIAPAKTKSKVPLIAAGVAAVLVLGILIGRGRKKEEAPTPEPTPPANVAKVDAPRTNDADAEAARKRQQDEDRATAAKLADEKAQIEAEAAAARDRDRKRKADAASAAADGSTELRYQKAMEKARGLYAAWQWAEASYAYGDALALKPGDTQAQRGVQDAGFAGAMENGRKALDTGRWSDAQSAYANALRIYPNNREAATQLSAAKYSAAMESGKRSYDAKNWNNAEADFQNALREKPGDADASRWLADTRREESRREEPRETENRPLRRPIREKKNAETTAKDVKGAVDKIFGK
jgi:tetratricopeptide (TPR) repeat protein